jgi:hypothetical protein
VPFYDQEFQRYLFSDPKQILTIPIYNLVPKRFFPRSLQNLQILFLSNRIRYFRKKIRVEYELDSYCSQSEKYELTKGVVSAKGKLKEKLVFWKNTIEANSFILNVIKECYKIPFIENPSFVFLSNNTSARKYLNFFTTAINQLILSGCVIEESSRPY